MDPQRPMGLFGASIFAQRSLLFRGPLRLPRDVPEPRHSGTRLQKRKSHRLLFRQTTSTPAEYIWNDIPACTTSRHNNLFRVLRHKGMQKKENKTLFTYLAFYWLWENCAEQAQKVMLFTERFEPYNRDTGYK